MKKALLVILAVLSSIILLLVISIALVFDLYSGVRPYTPDPVYSDDRSRVILPTIDYNKEDYENYLQVHLEIRDAMTAETLFQVQTRASDRMRWSVDWVGTRMIRLNSSDIGVYCWAEIEGGDWGEADCP